MNLYRNEDDAFRVIIVVEIGNVCYSNYYKQIIYSHFLLRGCRLDKNGRC